MKTISLWNLPANCAHSVLATLSNNLSSAIINRDYELARAIASTIHSISEEVIKIKNESTVETGK